MDIANKLDEALKFIAHSREELKQGNVVLLEGFQKEISQLCTEIGNRPVTEMQQYATKLDELGANMELLEEELKNQQAEVHSEIMNLNNKQKALKSYQTVDHSDKKEGE